jgi:hypothetical protein
VFEREKITFRMEQAIEAGARHPDELASLKLELNSGVEREMRLAQREAQIVNELSIERSKLLELNEQLNKIELEITSR